MAYTTIDNPELYFQTKLYTGTQNSHAITLDGSENMQPDWVWIKCRDDSHNHQIFDSARGVHKRMRTDTSGAETTSNESLKSFDSDGFTLGTQQNVNASASGDNSFVSWNWKAGTSFTNDASSTSVGSIDSAGSVNTTAGFSIISWTGDGNNGATIAHGLGATPAIIITKRRDDTGDWLVGGSLIDTVRGGANSLLLLNTTAAMDSNSEVYQTFSSTTFQVGVNAYTNTNNATMISYCFADTGNKFFKAGSYTGNGNADGTFVYTGFKPAVVICKKSSASGTNWGIIDNKRANSFNQISAMLNPNSSGTEGANNNCDFVSNGFKWRSSDGNSNASGDTYIYMCFAESPFTTSTGVPATAR